MLKLILEWENCNTNILEEWSHFFIQSPFKTAKCGSCLCGDPFSLLIPIQTYKNTNMLLITTISKLITTMLVKRYSLAFVMIASMWWPWPSNIQRYAPQDSRRCWLSTTHPSMRTASWFIRFPLLKSTISFSALLTLRTRLLIRHNSIRFLTLLYSGSSLIVFYSTMERYQGN